MKRCVSFFVLLCFFLIGSRYTEAAGVAPANAIPRIGGTWNVSGEGIKDGNQFYHKGAVTITSEIRNGVEWITGIEEYIVRFDAQKQLDWSEHKPRRAENREINSTEMVWEEDDITEVYTLTDSTHFESLRNGNGYQDARFVYTRPDPDERIPRIGGAWNAFAEGVNHDGSRYTLRGAATYTTRMDGDIEVTTGYSEETQMYDMVGRPIGDPRSFSFPIVPESRGDSRIGISYENEAVFSIFTLKNAVQRGSEAFTTELRRERVNPNANDPERPWSFEDWTYTREAPRSSGSGCSLTAGTPFALLLVLPLLSILRR